MLEKLKTFFSFKYFAMWFLLWVTRKTSKWMMDRPYRYLPLGIQFDVEAEDYPQILYYETPASNAESNVVAFARTGEFGEEKQYKFLYVSELDLQEQKWSDWEKNRFGMFLGGFRQRYGFEIYNFEDGRSLIFPTRSLIWMVETYHQFGMSVPFFWEMQERFERDHNRFLESRFMLHG